MPKASPRTAYRYDGVSRLVYDPPPTAKNGHPFTVEPGDVIFAEIVPDWVAPSFAERSDVTTIQPRGA